MEETGANKEIVGRIKKLRQDIDRQIKYTTQLKEMVGNTQGSRELVFAITKLEEARMWAGQALGALGNELPVEYQDRYVPGS